MRLSHRSIAPIALAALAVMTPRALAQAGDGPAWSVPEPLEAVDTDVSAGLVIRTALGLVALVVLVWLGSLPAVRRLEARAGLRPLLGSGLVLVAVGMLARHPAVNVLSDAVLADLTPALHVALGWLGFAIGYQFDVRMLDQLPRGVARTITVESALPFLVVAAGGAAFMLVFDPSGDDPLFLRHALALGAAGSISVVALRDRLPPWTPGEPSERLEARLDSLDEIVGVLGLAVIGAFFRPAWIEWRWELPGTVWLFLTVGVGVSVGLLTHVILRERERRSEFVAALIGCVALAAGVAGYLFLSPVAVGFLAGAVVATLPSDQRQRVWDVLVRWERPLIYLLLVVLGAMWDPFEWRGWALMGAFLSCRALGSWLGLRILDGLAATDQPEWRTSDAVLRPISPVSIAIVVSLALLYQGRAISWIVTAVVGSALFTELVVQWRDRRREREG